MENYFPCCHFSRETVNPVKTVDATPVTTPVATPKSNSYTPYPVSNRSAHSVTPAVPSTILYGLYDYSGLKNELSFRKDDEMLLLDDSDHEWIYARHLATNKEGYVPSNYVAAKDSLSSKSWFMGTINRKEAERLLKAENVTGSFLIRVRENVPDSFALSLLTSSCDVKHYKITKDHNENYLINDKRPFKSLDELVEHYSKIIDGLAHRLTIPCAKLKPVLTDLSKDMRDAWEIERSSVELIERIGSGQFGEVWRGLWNSKIDVAVKMLKPGSMSKESFLEESQIMKRCKHKNLVRLYAVCSIDEPILIVTELMCNGSLLEFLRADKNASLPFSNLVDMAAQIANGMSYLEANKFIHRDLAARNILVGEAEVKVADFGLARIIEDEEYNPRAGAKFPIKWTAPEAILKSKFSIKSDVWSFGILLIEIFTYGEIPYPGMTNRDVISFLERGDRLTAPKNCPQQINDILKYCWKSNPSERPTFAYLYDFFENFEASIECSYD